MDPYNSKISFKRPHVLIGMASTENHRYKLKWMLVTLFPLSISYSVKCWNGPINLIDLNKIVTACCTELLTAKLAGLRQNKFT